MESPEDKQWAKTYLLDPLTAPEPSQETGPGSSFNSSIPRSFSQHQGKGKAPATEYSLLPTPPQSASPTRSSFHPSNPYSPDHHRFSSLDEPAQAPTTPPNMKSSSNSSRFSAPTGYAPNSTGVGRSRSLHMPSSPPPPYSHKRGSSLSQPHSANTHNSESQHRSGSLNKRFPGDRSHRPLDMIKREARAADRGPQARRRNAPVTDTIDGLDKSFGAAYHHGGPYDATLATRNTNRLYSPVEALRESNMEALRATPREFIQDSLDKHVPLHGTAIIPPGERDMGGSLMDYTEGADLMREPDAPGGAYKRWEHVQYLPDDLKGKGEPSYTFEKDKKERKARQRYLSPEPNGAQDGNVFEMQPHTNSSRKNGNVMVRNRSFSASADRPTPGPSSPTGHSNSINIRRSNTTGKRLSDGLKRRFDNIRRKKSDD